MPLRAPLRATALAASCLAALCVGTVPDAAGAAEPYALGPADKVRVTVSQWSAAPPAPGGSQSWASPGGDFQTRLDGTFAVDTDGRVSLPMVGDVPAEGRSTAELGAAIAALFQGKFGTLTAPSASVEIIEYRPFYIVGVVDRPGSYPFRPGMTVLHALSIAGGLYRRPDMELGRYQRDLMSATGDTAVQAVNRDILLARIARLEAELAGRDAVALPDELAARKGDPGVVRAMADETKFLKQRQAALAAAVANQQQIKVLAENQNKAIEGQSAAIDRQIAVAKKELEDQTDLVSRGLSRRPVLFPIESRLAEAEGKKRQLHSDMLKNAQDVTRAEQTAVELRTTRRTEILDQIKEAQGNLEQVRQKIAGNGRVVEHATGEVARRTGEAQPAYAILRREGDRMRERAVAETAPVAPGDIVRVVLAGRGQHHP
ncbi:polysaccharide biosynthesis/export family protein, partial [Methylobacterium indicum]|uniref:polysaccharide biosynthesis/export family protein n=1 Tax=Methylobacterium indicum TaxID=1775910 RepID=UPI00069D72E8